ncbi:MAG: DUF4867 domain-containing protein [Firmicutes bacterium HGW-Firmicutes-16]|nr:MAG: DUF4867 domain-containing protein [Firmicutes bacterium HGW-Firmicutes-16]
MKIYEVTDPEFKFYGKIVEGVELSTLITALKEKTPLPEGTAYVPEDSALSSLPEAQAFGNSVYGGMPVQFGWCNGHNTKLNCLEYHRDSEFQLGTEDFILLLAKEDEIEGGKLDTAKVKAFRAPAGVALEIYATTLHYAPCQMDAAKGFRVMIALPKGTNTEKPEITPVTLEDRLLWACNKWLLAHSESDEAKAGAFVGLTGRNIDIKSEN